MPRENNSDSKFQLRNIGSLMHPGQCLACGSGNRTEGYVDLGTWFDFEGQMYLCAYCFEEAGEVLGMLTAKEADAIQRQNLTLLTENEKLTEKLTYADQRLESVEHLLAPLRTSISSTLDEQSTSDLKQSEGSDAHPSHAAAVSGESKSAKSVTKSRPDDASRTPISDLTGLKL